MPVTPASKILVVGPSWVGDMVMAQSLFMTLKQQHPGCLIDVLAPAWSRPLLERMPEVHAAIDMPFGHGEFGFGKRRRLGRQLRANNYAQAIVLPNSWKSALVPFFSGALKRTGYVGELRYGLLNDARRLDKTTLTMTVQRFCALAYAADAPQPSAIPTPVLSISAAGVDRALNKHGLDKEKPILVLCPGAEYGPAKRWPEEYYAEVACYWLAKGGQVWLFGSNKDESVTAAINTQTDNRCVDLAGRTSLGEAIDLMSLATHVVSNDSGLMHVAASLGRSLVAIYGSSDPGFTPPLNEQAQVLRLGLDCSPCFKRECPLGHLKCLKDLLPQQVIAALEQAS
ncbi:lipopolysaccharide heptosyltransferase II [Sulfuriflexus sp.]|uniref:lipopolysaccharide heptosyltransferase II n=1 Tax=Sulfuriflexus sp. TaxID=2015443 RepID=UPI0028CE0702|nr:lipopolysaccharide heptosyltransferase II [Sulfuriflexus sp.]MDT8404865.1 lipopolysaccharide heptosyltransferase II [Sulfuriflexus sp.]